MAWTWVKPAFTASWGTWLSGRGVTAVNVSNSKDLPLQFVIWCPGEFVELKAERDKARAITVDNNNLIAWKGSWKKATSTWSFKTMLNGEGVMMEFTLGPNENETKNIYMSSRGSVVTLIKTAVAAQAAAHANKGIVRSWLGGRDEPQSTVPPEPNLPPSISPSPTPVL